MPSNLNGRNSFKLNDSGELWINAGHCSAGIKVYVTAAITGYCFFRSQFPADVQTRHNIRELGKM